MSNVVVLPSAQKGVALLEILITFFILSIGLMGLAGLQLKALQFNQSAFQQSQAVVASYDLLDRMRLNRSAATGGLYKTGDWVDSRSGTTLADRDIKAWLESVKGNLPGGMGMVDCDANGICTVSIRWENRFKPELAEGEEADEDDAYETVSLSSQI